LAGAALARSSVTRKEHFLNHVQKEDIPSLTVESACAPVVEPAYATRGFPVESGATY
jgi:hypothetical protein